MVVWQEVTFSTSHLPISWIPRGVYLALPARSSSYPLIAVVFFYYIPNELWSPIRQYSMLNSLKFLLSTPAVDTAVAMFITMICAPLTLGQPPNFDPESMHSFYDDDDDVVSGVYHCNWTFVYTKVVTSSLTIHHHMVDVFTHFSRPQHLSPLTLFLFCQFVLAFF